MVTGMCIVRMHPIEIGDLGCLYQVGLFALWYSPPVTWASGLCKVSPVVINCTRLLHSHPPPLRTQRWHILFPGQSTDLFIWDKCSGQSVFGVWGWADYNTVEGLAPRWLCVSHTSAHAKAHGYQGLTAHTRHSPLPSCTPCASLLLLLFLMPGLNSPKPIPPGCLTWLRSSTTTK